jgi:hypothetical protein
MGDFDVFNPIPTIILSKSGIALLIISTCPSVTGSNVPGKRQIRAIKRC